MKFTNNPKRIGIFAYFDKDGIIDEYIPVLLKSVKEHCDYVLVVVNGYLLPEQAEKINKIVDDIKYRENIGLDITAYRYGFEYLGAENADAEEILFFNQTVFGPVLPLEKLFEEMDNRDLDFWGLTQHKGLVADLTDTIWKNVDYGYIPPHIQSYFFAVRKTMFQKPAFKEFWDNMPEIKTYVDAVSYHEMRFTKYFKDLGFISDTYVKCDEWEGFMDYPLMGMPVKTVTEKRCPFVKRKSFITKRTEILSIPQGGAGWELYEYIDKKTDYDVSLILENITRTCGVTEYIPALAPTYSPHNMENTGKNTLAVYCMESDVSQLKIIKSAKTLAENSKAIIFHKQNVDISLIKKELPRAELEQWGDITLADIIAKIDIKEYEYFLFISTKAPTLPDDLTDLTAVITAFNSIGNVSANIEMITSNTGIGVICPVLSATGDNFSRLTDIGECEDIANRVKNGDFGNVELGKTFMKLQIDSFFVAASELAFIQKACSVFAADGIEYNQIDYILPLCCAGQGKLVAFAIDWKDAVRCMWNTKEQLDTYTTLFSTKTKKCEGIVGFRAQGIVDFYNEKRYSSTLEDVFKAKLTIKQKIWIIIQIILSEKQFNNLYKLTHKGSLPKKNEAE